MMRLRVTALLAAALAVIAGVSAPSAQASQQADAGFTGPFTILQYLAENQWASQSFVAGASGPLTRVDLWLASDPASRVIPIVVTIRATDAQHLPTGAALASMTLQPDQVPLDLTDNRQGYTFSNPAFVTEGHEYAITFEVRAGAGDPTAYHEQMSAVGSGFPGQVGISVDQGATWFASTRTLGFQTYIGYPEVGGWTVERQGVGMPVSGSCSEVVDSGLDYGTGVHGGWQRAWQEWVPSGNPGVRGGWACARALVNKGGTTWSVDNSVL